MIRSKKTVLSATAGAILLATLSGAAAQGDEAVIKYRQNIMKGVGGHTGAIAQIVKGESPHKSHLAAHAQALHDLLAMAPEAFKEQTSGGDSRSKPEIWTDAAGFKRASDDAIKAAKAFAEAAASGDDALIGQRIKAVFDGCKGCHDDYREKKQ